MANYEISEQTVEFLERRLAEKVQDRVQSRMNRLFALIAAGGISIGGFSLYDVPKNIRASAEKTANEKVQQIIDSKIDPLVQEAQAQLAAAERQINRTGDLTELANKQIAAYSVRVEQAETQAIRTLAKIELAQKDWQSTTEDINGELTARSIKINNQFETYRDVSSDLAILARLTTQTRLLAQETLKAMEVKQVVNRANGGDVRQVAFSEERKSSIHEILAALEKLEHNITGGGRLTVLFQYAHMNQKDAEIIGVQLRNLDYVVPTEAPDKLDPETREVRFFEAADKDDAQRLAKQVQDVLAAEGLSKRHVTVRDLSGYQGRKPRARTLELWLSMDQTSEGG